MNQQTDFPSREDLINFAYGLLSTETRKQIEEQLEKDENLREEYHEIYSMIEENPDIDVEELIEQEIQSISFRGVTKAPVRTITFRRFFLLAAVLIGIVAGCFFLFQQGTNTKTNSLSDLINQEKDAVPLELTSMRDTTVQNWQIALRNNNYSQALLDLKLQDQTLPDIQFFTGLSWLKSDPSAGDSARKYLLACAQQNTFGFTDAAHYYLGISFVLDNQLTEAKHHFELVKGDHQPKAQDFLNLLKK